MNISNINYQSNQPSFSAIFRLRTHYTKTQRKIESRIYAGLNNYDLPMHTLEEKWESLGWDFVLSPETHGRIRLKAIKDAVFKDDRIYSVGEDKNIGVYSINKPFNPDDIETALSNKSK